MIGPGPDEQWHDLDGSQGDEAYAGLPWPWLLIILVTAAWFPLNSFWQSDDFIALAYAGDFGNVMADFTNPQYGAADIWLFYRPLITLSFWLDLQLAGAEPFLAHLSNALVHGVNAMLVALIWGRFLAPAAAWGAGLLWGLAPVHAGTVLWTVGRVDVYSTFWCLLSLWLLCRWWEGQNWARPASLVAFVAALCCKELAFVLPGLVLLVSFGLSGDSRTRMALKTAAPYFAVLVLFLIWRFWALGVFFGGYAGWSAQPGAALAGLGQTVLDLLNPLLHGGSEIQAEWLGGEPPAWVSWLGILPPLAGVVVLLASRRHGLLGFILLAFLGACIPLLPFWMASADVKNLRYYYLPFAALVGILAAGGIRVWIPALLVWASPLMEIRADYRTFESDMAAMHNQLLVDTAEEAETMLFVAGMPRQNSKGNVLGFHHGSDRLIGPPFGAGRHRIFALRPLVEQPSVHRLRDWEEEQYRIPEGITIVFEGPTILGRRMRSNPLPDLTVRQDAPQLTSAWMLQLASSEESGALVMEGVRATHYRITVFTAGGYLAAVVPDRGDPTATDGRVELRDLFNQDGRYARQGTDALLTLALPVPITMDLSTRFPVLVEAGHLVGVADAPFFQATHSSRRFLWFEFDRDFPAFVREVTGR